MSYRVLIVDDSSITRSVIIKALNISGIEIGTVYEANNGEEALKILSDNCVDIVFADINMPKMNGLVLVEKMAQNKIIDKTPVVIISSDRNQHKIDKLKELGVIKYLTKPLKPENLRDAVIAVLAPERIPAPNENRA